MFGQIQFMQKSICSQSPYKKRGESTHLNESANRQGAELSHYTQIKIETKNREVPFISIYKPDTTKEQHKIQAVTIFYKCLSHYYSARLHHTFVKIIACQFHRRRLNVNSIFFGEIVNKIKKRKTGSALYMLSVNKIKKRILQLGVRTLNRLQTNSKVYNCRYVLLMLKLNSCHQKINQINDSNQQAKKISLLQSQLSNMKIASFSQQFITKSKTFQKNIGNLIQNIRKNDYQSTIKLQIKRFEQERSKTSPKKRQMFEAQLILTVLVNIIKSYELFITQPDKNIKFIIQQGEEQLFPQKYFRALRNTLEFSKITPQVIQLIVSYKQNFVQNASKISELQQRIASQSQIQQMTIIISKLKNQNENLKAFESNYYDLVNKNSHKDSIIEQLRRQNSSKQQEIIALKQRLRQCSLINTDLTQRLNLASSKAHNQTGLIASPSRIDEFSIRSNSKLGLQNSLTSPIVLMKQILNLKMTLQTNSMNHEKELRQLRNQMFEYQTQINQLKADLLRKEHQYLKVLQENKDLKANIIELSKSDVRKSHTTRPSMGQTLEFQLSQLKQQKQAILNQLKQQRMTNQGLMMQVNQAKRQSYKRQKQLQQKLAQRDAKINELINPNLQHRQVQPNNNKQWLILARDQQIKLLTTKVNQLQALLHNIKDQYRQLRQQLQNGALLNHENTSIITFYQDKDPVEKFQNLSQKIKKLMASSESLVYSIDCNKEEIEQTCDKRHEPNMQNLLLQFLYVIFLDMGKISSSSQEGDKLWKDLCHLRATYTSKAFFAHLQLYCKEFISNPFK